MEKRTHKWNTWGGRNLCCISIQPRSAQTGARQSILVLLSTWACTSVQTFLPSSRAIVPKFADVCKCIQWPAIMQISWRGVSDSGPHYAVFTPHCSKTHVASCLSWCIQEQFHQRMRLEHNQSRYYTEVTTEARLLHYIALQHCIELYKTKLDFPVVFLSCVPKLDGFIGHKIVKYGGLSYAFMFPPRWYNLPYGYRPSAGEVPDKQWDSCHL